MKYRLKFRIMESVRAAWGKVIGRRLAEWLNKSHPEWCWAEIYTVVGMGWGLFNRDKWDGIRFSGCAKDCAKFGSCECGKLKK